jgi:hypothetical protein
MKKLVISLLVTGTLVAGYGQQPKIDKYKLSIPRDSLFSIASRNSLPGQARLVNILPNGDRVYRLPLDGAICIVPDPSVYNYKMPVLKGKIRGFMPNASPRVQIIPNNTQTPK